MFFGIFWHISLQHAELAASFKAFLHIWFIFFFGQSCCWFLAPWVVPEPDYTLPVFVG